MDSIGALAFAILEKRSSTPPRSGDHGLDAVCITKV
jgi:hypothetical protein